MDPFTDGLQDFDINSRGATIVTIIFKLTIPVDSILSFLNSQS